MKMVSYLPFFSFGIKRYLQKSGIEKNLKNVVHDPAMIDDEMRQGYLGPFIKKHDIFRALGRMLRDKEVDLLKEDLYTIHTPCLLIWGRHDRVVPLNIGQRLHEDLPNSELVVFEDIRASSSRGKTRRSVSNSINAQTQLTGHQTIQT